MTQLSDKIWAVEVPSDATNFQLADHKVRNLIDERDCKRLEWDAPQTTHKFIILESRVRFLFTTKTATEEDARKVVEGADSEGWGLLYMSYEKEGHMFSRATSSLRSLLRSKGLDEKNNYALIEKLSNDEIQ